MHLFLYSNFFEFCLTLIEKEKNCPLAKLKYFGFDPNFIGCPFSSFGIISEINSYGKLIQSTLLAFAGSS